MQVRKGDQPGASPVNLPGLSDARDAAGKEFGVSGKSVDHATKVLEVLPRAREGITLKENLPEALQGAPARAGGESNLGTSVPMQAGAPARAWGNILLPDVVDRWVEIGPFFQIIIG